MYLTKIICRLDCEILFFEEMTEIWLTKKIMHVSDLILSCVAETHS